MFFQLLQPARYVNDAYSGPGDAFFSKKDLVRFHTPSTKDSQFQTGRLDRKGTRNIDI